MCGTNFSAYFCHKSSAQYGQDKRNEGRYTCVFFELNVMTIEECKFRNSVIVNDVYATVTYISTVVA